MYINFFLSISLRFFVISLQAHVTVNVEIVRLIVRFVGPDLLEQVAIHQAVHLNGRSFPEITAVDAGRVPVRVRGVRVGGRRRHVRGQRGHQHGLHVAVL